jgi:hypothetical protein
MLRLPAPRHGLLLALALGAALKWGAEWDARLVQWPQDGVALAAQASDEEEGELEDGAPQSESGGPKTYQRIKKSADRRTAAYGFSNFNRDRIEISYSISEREFQPYNQSFGYKKEDITALRAGRDRAKQQAFADAQKKGLSQAQFNAVLAGLDKKYEADLKAYMSGHGFRIDKNNVVSVDMPNLVRKNKEYVKAISMEFDKFATSRRYRSGEIIGAVLSFVQTAMRYKLPDPVYKGKSTGGLLLPLTAVVLGWGDCDTKSGLMASLLSNWGQMRLVGVGVPGHYLLGVLQIPEKGDVFVQYDGLQYVLVEPAGPAWLPPGQVADTTIALLRSSEGYRIEPFYNN